MNDHIRDEERLRQMLDDAVSDVEPRHTLREIRGRTATRSRHGWMWVAGAAAVATAATVTAVVVFGGGPGTTGAQRPGFADESSTTGKQRPGSTDRSAAQDKSMTVPVYFVGDTGRGPRLFREFHTFEDVRITRAELAVRLAVYGPPHDPDYRTDWDPGSTYATAHAAEGIITVDIINAATFQTRLEGMSVAEAEMAVEQVMYTAQAVLRSDEPVKFLLDGRPTDRVFGIPAERPLSPGTPEDVLAQVWIDKPAEGQILQREFTVTGLANAFEANVQWELMQGEEVVKRGYTTAEECCTMAPYSFMVTAPPGDYTLVVHDGDPSGGEGFASWRDTKQITVE